VVVERLLAEDGVAGPVVGQHSGDGGLGGGVPGVPQVPAGEPALRAQPGQDGGGRPGRLGRDLDVPHDRSDGAVASVGRRGGAYWPEAFVIDPK
jgi:hypothetical protein